MNKQITLKEISKDYLVQIVYQNIEDNKRAQEFILRSVPKDFRKYINFKANKENFKEMTELELVQLEQNGAWLSTKIQDKIEDDYEGHSVVVDVYIKHKETNELAYLGTNEEGDSFLLYVEAFESPLYAWKLDWEME